jgi:enterochelin esterase family protein
MRSIRGQTTPTGCDHGNRQATMYNWASETMRVVRSLLLTFLVCLVLSACQTNNPLALPTDTPAPPTVTPQATPTPTPMPGSIAGFDDFLSQAQSQMSDLRQEMANRYVGSLGQVPVAGQDEAIFLFRGAAQSVQILGDMNNWDVEQAPPMMRLDGTDLWYWRSTFEPDARLDYRIVVDSREAVLDPLNPNTVPGPQGPNSELRMPGYQQPPELQPPDLPVPSGTVSSHTLESQLLGQTRTFQVYEPPGQIVGQSLPVVIINNGSDYLNLINTPVILDSLIAGRQIPPLLAVFVTPINATEDYSLNDAYAGFLAEELVSYVVRTFGAGDDPQATGIMGNSLGGLAAVHAAMSYPDVFGLAAAQSGRFGLQNGALIQEINRTAARRAGQNSPRLYLVTGTYETDIEGENILASNRSLAEALEAGGFDYVLDERPEGHSWGLWRETLGQALSTLFQTAS